MWESWWCWLTVDKDSKAKEVQISLSSTGVPANVRISFRQEHWTHLQPAASQVRHHLHRRQKEFMWVPEWVLVVLLLLCFIFKPFPGPAPVEPTPARCYQCRRLQPRPEGWSHSYLSGESKRRQVIHFMLSNHRMNQQVSLTHLSLSHKQQRNCCVTVEYNKVLSLAPCVSVLWLSLVWIVFWVALHQFHQFQVNYDPQMSSFKSIVLSLYKCLVVRSSALLSYSNVFTKCPAFWILHHQIQILISHIHIHSWYNTPVPGTMEFPV